MFADLDESLRQMLIREVPLPAADVDIVFERPDREHTARFSRPTVDLFLFSIDENRDFVESGWQVTRNGDNTATLRWPPLRVDVHYLVTVWTQAVDDEHNLLYHLYRTFRRIVEVPADLLEGALERQPRPVSLAIEPSELSPLMDLWGALDNTVRAGLVLTATVAVDLDESYEVPQVRTSGLRLGPMNGGQEARYQVTGRVRNAAGEPVVGATVRAGGRSEPVLTAKDGSYRLGSLTGREVELAVAAENYGTETRTVALPGDYDFTLTPATGEPAADGTTRARARRNRGGGT